MKIQSSVCPKNCVPKLEQIKPNKEVLQHFVDKVNLFNIVIVQLQWWMLMQFFYYVCDKLQILRFSYADSSWQFKFLLETKRSTIYPAKEKKIFPVSQKQVKAHDHFPSLVINKLVAFFIVSFLFVTIKKFNSTSSVNFFANTAV